MIKKITSFALGFMSIGLAAGSFADDTELYVLETSARSNSNPQVLIIFDTSGSMGGDDNTSSDFTAPRFHVQSSLGSSTKLYFSTDPEVIPAASSNQYFLNGINGCDSSSGFLNEYGMYTGYFREYQSGKWVEFPADDGSAISTVDCYEDIADSNTNNASGSGYPVDGLASPYDADIEKAKLTEFGLGNPLSIYTEQYVTWYHDDSKPNGKTDSIPYKRMDVAKRVLQEVITNTPGVDFGIEIFNYNTGGSTSDPRDGGRIIAGISPSSVANKNALNSTIEDLVSIYRNHTPLCETLFEAYSYMYGKSVTFGHDTGNSIGTDKNPTYDSSVENAAGTSYISPFIDKQCQSNASIIYVTDGVPNKDTAADNAIKTLLGLDTSTGSGSVTGNVGGNLMPPLAGWMANNDVNSNVPGVQAVTTYTIGFSEGAEAAKEILEKTAELGKGKYYSALTASALQASLLKALAAIKEDSASFSSPSVALDKTQTGDDAYFAMFLPDEGPRWSGNLKKFKVSDNGTLLDQNDAEALDDTGFIAEDACPLWTTAAVCSGANYEGYDVSDGGVAEVLRELHKTDVSTRKVLINKGSSGALVSFSKANAQQNSHLNTDAKLAAHMGVEESALGDSFKWAMGENVDDEKYDETNNSTAAPYLRKDIIGDPLHSRPLVINYGNSSSPDIRILMGTNHGFLHMFKDEETGGVSSVSESWAFMPTELLPNIKGLRDNPKTGVHSIYGIDSTPVPYIERDGDGKVTKAWLFVGMRRGGSSYYALDITSPDSPSLKWISSTSTFNFMGQSWAEPVVTKVPGWPAGATAASTASPVIIVGAGYTPATKDGSGVGSNDTTGAGIYIIDADTGAKVHSFGLSGSDTVIPGLEDSIPNQVAILDSNNDQLTDRIYATDTGANVWRLDLPGLPTNTSAPWSAFKFASLGGNTTTSDIRFFSAPVVAQTSFSNIAEHTHTDTEGNSTTSNTYQNIPYDAVVIGSGHRPHPLDKERSDRFFTLQDRNIITKSYSSAAGNEAPEALELIDLYNVTTESPSSDSEAITFGTKRGWYYNFADTGEKSLSAATIVYGRVFFTSYVPETGASDEACLVPGQGRLYGFDLHKGARSYSYSEDYFSMGEQVPDTPQIFISSPDENGDSSTYFITPDLPMEKVDGSEPDGCAEGDDKCIGGGLGVNRIYYHQNEN
ncbi:rRNA (guanine-N1)-methyltransferase [Shewanella olleyana]|uniref:pilus assembly protein n=1 Tax=Shewanella olleyana TaxID=135626 RepID=UPI00200DE143|nr:PilC/PilY family type IV pilus protein [Shewanella olleyana]MCL1068264.1 rRNA (guanine-N1)-methyltransferase [Shewanella olleyana]